MDHSPVEPEIVKHLDVIPNVGVFYFPPTSLSPEQQLAEIEKTVEVLAYLHALVCRDYHWKSEAASEARHWIKNLKDLLVEERGKLEVLAPPAHEINAGINGHG